MQVEGGGETRVSGGNKRAGWRETHDYKIKQEITEIDNDKCFKHIGIF